MWIRQESLSRRGAAGVLGRGVAERPGHEESDSGKVVRDLPGTGRRRLCLRSCDPPPGQRRTDDASWRHRKGSAQGAGVAEEEQVAYQLLEDQRFARVQLVQVQAALVTQFVQRVFFQDCADSTSVVSLPFVVFVKSLRVLSA